MSSNGQALKRSLLLSREDARGMMGPGSWWQMLAAILGGTAFTRQLSDAGQPLAASRFARGVLTDQVHSGGRSLDNPSPCIHAHCLPMHEHCLLCLFWASAPQQAWAHSAYARQQIRLLMPLCNANVSVLNIKLRACLLPIFAGSLKR